jgi:hypothetical protein
MRDPHVAELKYRLSPLDRVSFVPEPSLDFQNELLSGRLSGDSLTITPKVHFATVEEARAVTDPFLRAWELDDALTHGSTQFRFDYQDVVIVDRNPPPPGSSVKIVVGVAEITLASDTITVSVARSVFPQPPGAFVATPDAESLWNRYEGYVSGREPILSMAYFCLTLIEARGGSRAGAAKAFRIERRVLDSLGRLTSERGDPSVARKFPRRVPPTPLTATEIAWIEAAVRAIIRRVGDVQQIAHLPEITMGDLPLA